MIDIDIGIDGAATFGWGAVFIHGRLDHLAKISPNVDPPYSLYARRDELHVHLEHPVVSFAGHTAGKSPLGTLNVRSTIDRLYALYSRIGTCTMYTPNAWKGVTPKPIHHARILEALSSDELRAIDMTCPGLRAYIARKKDAYAVNANVAYASKDTNWMDAIGIALFGIGRIDKQGIRK